MFWMRWSDVCGQLSTNADHFAPDKTTIPGALSRWQEWLHKTGLRTMPVALGDTTGHNGNGRHDFTESFISGFY